MADRRRRPTLSLTSILCFSLWFSPGQTVNSFFDIFLQQYVGECPAKYFTHTYGVQCTDSCDQRGYDYYWCESKSGWDYCSPGVNIDFHGKTCRGDYPCGDYADNSNTCFLDEGAWSKCARVEPRAMIHYTRYQKLCIDECQYYASGDYFWCNTDGSNWDYCSPLPDITYNGVDCRMGHKCETYDQDYSWCYTSFNNDWDYCGTIHPGECAYSRSYRRKRQPDFPNVICTTDNNNIRRTTTFRDEGGSSIMAEISNRMRNEALNLINQWDNQRLSQQARSNLISSDNLRIDNQGLITRNNQRCYNLQIQINKARSSRESTTVAQVICPLDTSPEYIRTAFRRSLERQARVIMEVEEGPSTSFNNNNNKKFCKRRKQ